MKRTLILVAAGLALCFGLLTLRKESPRTAPGSAPASDSEQRRRLQRFWDHYHEATRLRTGSQWKEAIPRYRSALEIDPKHAESLYYLGTCLLEIGQYEQAREAYEKLTRLNPRSQRALTQLGQLLSSRLPGAPAPDFERARMLFERTAEINPEESGPFLRLGFLALKQGDLEGAGQHFLTAAGFRSPQGAFLVGYVHFLEGNEKAATAFLQRVLESERREQELSGRGAVSEGDTASSGGSLELTPLASAALQSRLLLSWLGRSAESQPGSSAAPPPPQGLSFRPLDVGREGAFEEGTGTDPVLLLQTESTELRAFRSGWALRLEGADPASGIQFEGTPVDVSSADFDRDSLVDLLVLRWKLPAILYRNLGRRGFTAFTAESGLPEVGGESLVGLFLDYDRDGWIDLFVAGRASSDQVAWSLLHPATECPGRTPRLFRNEAGRFHEVTRETGLSRCYGTAAAAVADVDEDGWPDLILANGGFEGDLAQPSVLLRNQQGQRFAEVFLPAFDQPGLARGVRVRPSPRGGRPEIYLEGVGVFQLR